METKEIKCSFCGRGENECHEIIGNEKQKIQSFNIGIITESPKIEVYLPNDTYQALSVDADTSDVNIRQDNFSRISVRCQIPASHIFHTDSSGLLTDFQVSRKFNILNIHSSGI